MKTIDVGSAPRLDGPLCAETDPELFFPPVGGANREAKAVCDRCTVRVECLSVALERGERYGVWGGLSEAERRPLIHQQESA